MFVNIEYIEFKGRQRHLLPYCLEIEDSLKSKLLSLDDTFLSNIKRFGYQIGIQFNSTLLVVEQNNYTTKIVNAYIVYDLDSRPKITVNNFALKNCLFGATNRVKIAIKVNFLILAMECHLVQQLHGVLAMTLLQMF